MSVSDVAVAAGVVKSAIYHHFENKEALYLAVLKEVALQSRDQMREGAQGDTWRARSPASAGSIPPGSAPAPSRPSSPDRD
ncbi:MAG: TetR/AcrR family transcriptional regulator, partial [Chloroflexi bacterium]|nr:TetR/AcrR family transcriptional regulator [Chloroflexota bacterium]